MLALLVLLQQLGRRYRGPGLAWCPSPADTLGRRYWRVVMPLERRKQWNTESDPTDLHIHTHSQARTHARTRTHAHKQIHARKHARPG